MRVAFQGETGAYSEAAALEHYGPEITPVACESFAALFAAVEQGACDAGLIPIENSLAGSIHQNYDLLLQHSLSIVGEHYLRVQHCLIALPGVKIEEITRVISHPQGLAQCGRFLSNLPEVKVAAVYDTAGSVKMVRDQGSRSTAAIASRRAAEVYGMAVLEEGIEDDPANFTRFLAVAPKPVAPGPDAKTSIVFSLQNRPGALFKALSVFALRDLDLTKIESRPLVGSPWEYLFYIDFAGSTENLTVSRALAHLGEYALMLRVLGSYPRHKPGNA
ncbi:MAG: prephenate dehydratase [Chloroflexi bacterium]|nr:prephenate dehydratase [Chloroflexota bacterium]